MISMTRDLIEYVGIDECLPLSPKNFTQFNIEDEVCIPNPKPDIEQIVKVSSEAVIKNKKIVRTPKGVSLEGFKLTGHKTLVEGVINYKIQYVADTESQSVHIAHFCTPFISFIVLPENFCPSSTFIISAFIEDIYVNTIDTRSIYINTTLLLTAEEC